MASFVGSMFESLYDVLNQRYVRKTDIETGHEKRMLRLALGPRSQLCPVEDGFKLIVIVDQQQAYDSLDLPLLNRFEKQVLFPSDLLRSDKCELALNKLQSMCTTILEESELGSLSEIFCGYYDKTIPSLLLNITDFGRKDIIMSTVRQSPDSAHIIMDDLVKSCAERLARVAFPTAMMRSPTLRSIMSESHDKQFSGKQFSLTQRHIFALLDDELYGGDTTAGKLLVVTTKSPVAHFQLACDSWRLACESAETKKRYTIRCSHLKVLQLALISSEKQLTTDLKNFLHAQSAGAPTTLVVLCDPLHCSSTLISHARFVCARAMQSFCTNDTHGKFNYRHIVFIMHLPPGVRNRRREYILDFNPPWDYAFVDDVRADGGWEGLSLDDLVRISPYGIYSANPDSLRRTLIDSFQSALSRSFSPARDITSVSPAQRSYFKVTMDLLNDDCFMDFVQKCSLLCLRHVEDTDSNDVPLQVTIACTDYKDAAGTLQESLIMGLENVVVQTLSHIIRSIDHDFNMGCIYTLLCDADTGAAPQLMKSWLALATIVCSPESIARSSLVVAPSSPDYNRDCIIRNSGLHGALSCRFPFSEKLVAIIGHEHTRQQVEAAVASSLAGEPSSSGGPVILNSIRSTASFLSAAMGGETEGTPLGVFAAADAEAYLHDFVAIVIHPMPGVTFDIYFRLFKLMIQSDVAGCLEPSNWYLPSVVHACYWAHELEFFHIGAIISAVHSVDCPSVSSPVFMESPLGEVLLAAAENELQTTRGLSLELLICQLICEYFLQRTFMCIDRDVKAHAHTQTAAGDIKNAAAVLRIVRKILPHLRVLVTDCLQRIPTDDTNEPQGLSQEHLSILQPFWRLVSSNLMVGEVLHAISCAVKEDRPLGPLCASALPLLDNLFNYSPLSSDSFRDMLNVCDLSGFPYCALLRSYTRSFVRNEWEFLNNTVGISVSYSPELIDTMGLLLSPSTKYHYSVEKNGFLLMRKEVMSFLVHVLNSSHEASAGRARGALVAAMSQASAVGTEAILLYLGHLEDMYSSGTLFSSDEVSDLFSFMSTADDATVLATFHKSAPVIIAQAVFVRDEIRRYSAAVATYIAHTTYTDCNFPCCSHDGLTAMMMTADWAKVFFIKCLRDIGGNEMLVEYLKRKNNHPALPTATLLIDDNRRKSLGACVVDPFGMLHGKDAYVMACEAYRAAALRTASHAPLDSFLRTMCQDHAMSRRSSLGLLVAAAFSGHARGDNTTVLKEWLNLEFPLLHVNGCANGTYDTNGVAKRTLEWIFQLEDSDTKSKWDHGADQLVLHAAILAIKNPTSWLEMVVMNPAHLARVFVPSMPVNIMASLVSAMGYVGWYKCRNGHPYTVGNCTYPMEESVCSAPGCNAKIGGRNHESVKGTTRISTESDGFTSDPGYIDQVVLEKSSYNNDITVMVVRLLLHSLMYLSSFDPLAEKGLQGLMTASRRPMASSVRDTIKRRMQFDFQTLKEITMLSGDDLFMALHMTLQKWGDVIGGSASKYNLSSCRDRWVTSYRPGRICNDVNDGSH